MSQRDDAELPFRPLASKVRECKDALIKVEAAFQVSGAQALGQKKEFLTSLPATSQRVGYLRPCLVWLSEMELNSQFGYHLSIDNITAIQTRLQGAALLRTMQLTEVAGSKSLVPAPIAVSVPLHQWVHHPPSAVTTTTVISTSHIPASKAMLSSQPDFQWWVLRIHYFLAGLLTVQFTKRNLLKLCTLTRFCQGMPLNLWAGSPPERRGI